MADFLNSIAPLLSELPLHTILLIAIIVLWRKLEATSKTVMEQATKTAEAFSTYKECLDTQTLLKTQIEGLEREIKQYVETNTPKY